MYITLEAGTPWRWSSKALQSVPRGKIATRGKALEQVPCQSLRSFRFVRSPFHVSLEVSPLRSFAAALASYDPWDVGATDIDFTNDRELSSFVSLTKCQSLLAAHGLNLEEAAALIRTPRMCAESNIAKQTAGVLSALLAYRAKMLAVFDVFKSSSHQTACTKRTGPLRFFVGDRQGNTTAQK